MTVRSAQMLFAAVIATRATVYLFSTLLLQEMGPFMLMGLRFLLAFAILFLVFFRRMLKLNRRVVWQGAVLGLIFFIVMTAELNALTLTSSSKVSFLENLALVMVPLFAALAARRAPVLKDMLAAVVAIVGVGFLTLVGTQAGFDWGEGLALIAAVFYALVILATDRFSSESDGIALGVLQMGFMGLFGAVAAAFTEVPALLQTPVEWGYLAVLVLVCSGFGFTFQPVAQRYLPPERASILLALNPFIAGLLGVVVLGEPFGPQTLAGMALIVCAIVISSLNVEMPLRLRAHGGKRSDS